MQRRFATVVVGAVLALVAFAPAALASGGVNSGGVNSGGGGGGGGGTTTPPPTTACATIKSFSNSTGYYSVYAAIWTSFSISSTCTANWQMTYTNGTTGAVDFARGSSTAYQTSGTIDEDWAAFSTTYTVSLTITDASGAVLDSRSALVTTKAPKSGA